MQKFNLVVNSYVGLVACAVGFSVSEYIAKGSFSNILLFVVLLSSGVAIFSSSTAQIAAWGLAVGGMALGWSIGQALWGDLP